MSVKTFVELSGKTQSSNLDILAFVDSGYTSTYQINKQTFFSSVLPVKYSNNTNNNIMSSWVDFNAIAQTQFFATILGGNENSIENEGYHNSIIGGKRNRIYNGDYTKSNNIILGGIGAFINGGNSSFVIGGGGNGIQSSDYSNVLGRTNNITSANDSNIVGGHGHSINGANESGIFGGYSNSMSSAQDSAILGGRGNLINNGYSCCGGSVIAGGENNYIHNTPSIYNGIFAGQSNIIQYTSPYSVIIGGVSNVLNAADKSVIIESSATTIFNNDFSGVIGGKGNNISSNPSFKSNDNYIINSINCRIEEDGQYTSSGITMINCADMDIENQENITYIGVTGKTYVNGGGFGKGTGNQPLVVLPSTYTYNTSFFEADVYTATTIQIDPRKSDHIVINTDGASTYNISFVPDPQSAAYAHFTFYINFVAGSTINFANTTYSSWRWAGGSAPSFSGTNTNIIVVSTLKTEDVFEVSRSMYIP